MQEQFFDRGIFTISLDFELLWGCFDSGKHQKYIDHFNNTGAPPFETTREIIDRLLTLFNQYDTRVTWAILGHLFLDRCEATGGQKHPEMPRPQHPWFPDDWYLLDPCSDYRQAPLWYGRDMVEKVLAAEPKHEVGSHSFSHVIFNDAGCTEEVAEAEIGRCVELAGALNLKMKSFIFPRNALGHLNTLRKYGFTVTRGPLPFWFMKYGSRTARRLGHVVDDVLAITPDCGLPEKSPSGLWVVPFSMFLQSMDGPRRFIPARSRVRKAIRGFQRCIEEKSIFHLTFHPISNMCIRTEEMFDVLERILAYAAERRAQGRLDVMTMAQIAELCEHQITGGEKR